MKENIQHGLKGGFDWQYLGALLANKSATVQAEFFKSFLKEMQTWETCWQTQQQLSAINIDLTKKERELLSYITYEGD